MKIEKLTESEEIVMKSAWDCKKENPVLADIEEIATTVYGKDWKNQTISTFLQRLVQKKYLRIQRDGKRYPYEILIDERTYRKAQLRRLYYFIYKCDKAAIEQDVQQL